MIRESILTHLRSADNTLTSQPLFVPKLLPKDQGWGEQYKLDYEMANISTSKCVSRKGLTISNHTVREGYCTAVLHDGHIGARLDGVW